MSTPKKENIFVASRNELKSPRTLTTTAILIALSMILSYMTIRVSPTFQINLQLMPCILIAYLYGPTVAALSGIAIDVLGWVANPNGGFFPGFTFTAIVSGILFGLVLYRQEISLVRTIVIAEIRGVVCAMGLNTFWLYLMYGESSLLSFPARAITAVLLMLIDGFLAFVVAKALKQAGLALNSR